MTSPLTPTGVSEIHGIVKLVIEDAALHITSGSTPEHVARCIIDMLTTMYPEDRVRTVSKQPKPVKSRMFPPVHIGIAGYTGSGKDTLSHALADAILREYPDTEFRWIPFTQEVGNQVVDMLLDWLAKHGLQVENLPEANWPQPLRDTLPTLLFDDWKEEIGRPFKQALGEFAMKAAGSDYWVDMLRLHVGNQPTAVIFTPDVRYPHMTRLFTEEKRGVLIATSALNRRTGEQFVTSAHISEQGIPECQDIAHYVVPGHISEGEPLVNYCTHYIVPMIEARYKRLHTVTSTDLTADHLWLSCSSIHGAPKIGAPCKAPDSCHWGPSLTTTVDYSTPTITPNYCTLPIEQHPEWTDDTN